ncbi:MAG: LPS assembly lipoprotein LptE [Bacteroidota bacterium]
MTIKTYHVRWSQLKAFLLMLIGTFTLNSCIPGIYGFKGTNFDPNIETFYVHPFELRANSAPPTITQTMEEGLKLKIRQESSIDENDTQPDIEFKGRVTRFESRPQAPEAGEAIGFNRLTIAIEIEYIDNFHDDEKYNWKQTFSRFEDFGEAVNLLDVQDELIDVITQQIYEDIFNKAFTDW